MGDRESRELATWLDSDRGIQNGIAENVRKNLLRKMGNETFDGPKSVKAWRLVADAAAKGYVKEFGPNGERIDAGLRTFTVADRNAVALELAKDFVVETRLGNHDIIFSKARKKDSTKIRRRVVAKLSTFK